MHAYVDRCVAKVDAFLLQEVCIGCELCLFLPLCTCTCAPSAALAELRQGMIDMGASL